MSFLLSCLVLFQFTHPGGVRRHSTLSDKPANGFNSRTREGCDAWCSLLSNCYTKFQFTHPGGVRPQGRETFHQESQVSIHAPGRGATEH